MNTGNECGSERSRAVIHCDMDNYFAAVEEKHNPSLSQVPFAVCGDPAMRHSIIMAKNSLAKRAGVLTGISYRQARQICPELVYVKADLNKYLAQTKQVRAIFHRYSDVVVPYGMDEAWIDLGGSDADCRTKATSGSKKPIAMHLC